MVEKLIVGTKNVITRFIIDSVNYSRTLLMIEGSREGDFLNSFNTYENALQRQFQKTVLLLETLGFETNRSKKLIQLVLEISIDQYCRVETTPTHLAIIKSQILPRLSHMESNHFTTGIYKGIIRDLFHETLNFLPLELHIGYLIDDAVNEDFDTKVDQIVGDNELRWDDFFNGTFDESININPTLPDVFKEFLYLRVENPTNVLGILNFSPVQKEIVDAQLSNGDVVQLIRLENENMEFFSSFLAYKLVHENSDFEQKNQADQASFMRNFNQKVHSIFYLAKQMDINASNIDGKLITLLYTKVIQQLDQQSRHQVKATDEELLLEIYNDFPGLRRKGGEYSTQLLKMLHTFREPGQIVEAFRLLNNIGEGSKVDYSLVGLNLEASVGPKNAKFLPKNLVGVNFLVKEKEQVNVQFSVNSGKVDVNFLIEEHVDVQFSSVNSIGASIAGILAESTNFANFQQISQMTSQQNKELFLEIFRGSSGEVGLASFLPKPIYEDVIRFYSSLDDSLRNITPEDAPSIEVYQIAVGEILMAQNMMIEGLRDFVQQVFPTFRQSLRDQPYAKDVLIYSVDRTLLLLNNYLKKIIEITNFLDPCSFRVACVINEPVIVLDGIMLYRQIQSETSLVNYFLTLYRMRDMLQTAFSHKNDEILAISRKYDQQKNELSNRLRIAESSAATLNQEKEALENLLVQKEEELSAFAAHQTVQLIERNLQLEAEKREKEALQQLLVQKEEELAHQTVQLIERNLQLEAEKREKESLEHLFVQKEEELKGKRKINYEEQSFHMPSKKAKTYQESYSNTKGEKRKQINQEYSEMATSKKSLEYKYFNQKNNITKNSYEGEAAKLKYLDSRHITHEAEPVKLLESSYYQSKDSSSPSTSSHDSI